MTRMFGIVALAGGAVLAAGVVTAQAQAVPHQKPGLWTADITMAGQHVSEQMCVDAASEARASAFGAQVSKKNCQSQKISHNPDGSWSSISTCKTGSEPVRTTRADISGDFNSKITMSMRTPPTAAPEMTMTSTWLGPCKPGQRGGDVIMSNGMKMNLLDGTAAPGTAHH
jgi:hypothetical protein